MKRAKRWIDRWDRSEHGVIKIYMRDLIEMLEDHVCMGRSCDVCRTQNEIETEYRLGNSEAVSEAPNGVPASARTGQRPTKEGLDAGALLLLPAVPLEETKA